MKSKNKNGHLFLVLLLLIVLFIWFQSLQPGSISHGESRWVLKMARRLLDGNRLGSWLSDRRIRRLAHLTEYSSLGFFAGLYCWKRWGKIFQLRIFVLGVAIASMDEIFQYFAGGRTATWKDVCLDGAGVLAGIAAGKILKFFAE